ncbi:hypothetical protein KIM322_13570 [Lactobacillus xylocopicola]|uniref:Uncharacterized protein n=2 Tax=Lactobacillus xylocopicola TaxID=2976676 RepID=A0ABN6SP78_9LACO|nr:hypothetical protein KIM322_13570 [Lactobacillus xylocopicola]
MIMRDIFYILDRVIISYGIIGLLYSVKKYYNNNRYPLAQSKLSKAMKLCFTALLLIPWIFPLATILFPLTSVPPTYLHRAVTASALFPLAALVTDAVLYAFTWLQQKNYLNKKVN